MLHCYRFIKKNDSFKLFSVCGLLELREKGLVCEFWASGFFCNST